MMLENPRHLPKSPISNCAAPGSKQHSMSTPWNTLNCCKRKPSSTKRLENTLGYGIPGAKSYSSCFFLKAKNFKSCCQTLQVLVDCLDLPPGHLMIMLEHPTGLNPTALHAFVPRHISRGSFALAFDFRSGARDGVPVALSSSSSSGLKFHG